MAKNPGGRAIHGATGSQPAQWPANSDAREPYAAAAGGQTVQCQTVLENIRDGFIALDRDYRCTYVNPAAAAILNTTTDKLIGQPLSDAFPPPRYPQLHAEITRAAEQNAFVKFQEYCEQCGRWFEWHCYPAEDGLAIFLEDVSERKQAEEQVVRSEQHYRLLFETMPQGIVYQDADGRVISMNPAAERILGRTPEELLGRTAAEEEHYTLREDGSPFPGLEHPSMVALRTGQEVRDVVMGVYNPREQAYRWINITAVPLVRPGEGKPFQVYNHFSDITELRQATRALQYSERRFRKLFEADLIGIFITKPDGTFLDCNDAMVKMLGYASREEVLRHRSTELYVDPEFRQEAIRILQKDGLYLGKEGRVWRKDGSIAHLLGAAVLLKDEETGEPYVQGVAVDITERRQAELALANSQQLLQRITEATPEVIYIYDVLEHRNIYANRKRSEILGYSDAECDAMGDEFLQQMMHPEDFPLVSQQLLRLETAPEGEVLESDYRMRHADGTYHWFRSRDLVFARTADGRVRQVLGLAQDVTERKRAEEALRASEQRYRKLFEANLAGVYITKLDGTIVDFNTAMMKMLGYDSREEIFQHRVMDFYVDPELRQELIRLLRKEGVIQGREILLRKKDGSDLYALGSAVLLTEERTGEPYIQGVALDVTERKEAAERLARNLRDLEVLSVSATHYLEALPSHELFHYTAQQLQAVVGKAVIAVSEYSPRTNQTTVRAVAGPAGKLRRVSLLLRRDPLGLAFTVAPGTRERMVRGRLDLVEGGLYDLTFHQMPWPLCLLIERTLRLGAIYAMPFYLGEDLMGTVAVATDRAEGLQNRELIEAIVNQAALALKRTRTEEALRESEQALRDLTATLEAQVARRTAELEHRARQLQKLALELSETEERERERLAGILHDDLQQILAAAKFHLGFLSNRCKEDEALQKMTEQVRQLLVEAIGKSRSLSHELSPPGLAHNDLHETFEWLAGQVKAKHGLTVHLDVRDRVELTSEPLKILLYRAAQEMLFNVIKHAGVREAKLRLRRRGGAVCLSVSDQGQGFAVEEPGPAGGLGLGSIRERVKLLGGRMKVRSLPGKGSTFRIVVPDARPPVTGAQDVTMEKAVPGATAMEKRQTGPGEQVLRVLLADDHKIVREGIESMLVGEPDIEIVGQAGNGREAVDLACRLEPDVVVMDVSMPVMSGDEATRQIKRHRPQTRVIALSMHDEAQVSNRMRRAGAAAYLSKTAPSEELLAAIRGN